MFRHFTKCFVHLAECNIHASVAGIITGSDNGLAPIRHQAIIWNNAGLLLIGSLGTNFREIWIKIKQFSFMRKHLKMTAAKWQPFCLVLNVLNNAAWLVQTYSKSLTAKILNSPV